MKHRGSNCDRRVTRVTTKFALCLASILHYHSLLILPDGYIIKYTDMAATPESLALLEAHGRAFLESFGISSSPSTKRAAEAAPPKSSNKRRRTSLAKKVVVPPSEPSSG